MSVIVVFLRPLGLRLYTRSEFRYGKFQRVIPLPAAVQHEQVQAEYKDGILRLNLPKAEADKSDRSHVVL